MLPLCPFFPLFQRAKAQPKSDPKGGKSPEAEKNKDKILICTDVCPVFFFLLFRYFRTLPPRDFCSAPPGALFGCAFALWYKGKKGQAPLSIPSNDSVIVVIV